MKICLYVCRRSPAINETNFPMLLSSYSSVALIRRYLYVKLFFDFLRSVSLPLKNKAHDKLNKIEKKNQSFWHESGLSTGVNPKSCT